jgi:hypothetical protein
MVSLALLAWPVITLLIFRRMQPGMAVAVSILSGYLLLPSKGGWDFPLIPTLNKVSIISLSCLAMAYAVTRGQPHRPDDQSTILSGWLPRSKTGLVLGMVYIIGSLCTALLNDRPMIYELRVLRGLTLYDGISSALAIAISLIPLLLARKFLAHPEGQRTLLIALAIAGLIYSLPTLYEVRMSPQLNRMVYGFFPHAWIQHLRGDGYRPLVFLHHGLWLGIFLCMSVIATASLTRSATGQRKWFFLALIWLTTTLLLCKTFGALAIACLLVPCALLMPGRLQLLAAMSLAICVLAYPALRGAGLVPTESVVAMVTRIDQERASSLRFRLNNEDILLEKANQKPLFGWGESGRARVYDEQGNDIATTDGNWIITIGEGGWTRYFSQMGLMALPILFLALNRRRYNLDQATIGLCLVLAANMVDLIPNGTQTPVTWLVAGALLGRLELGRITEPGTVSPAMALTRSPYTRQRHPVLRLQ